MTYDTVKIFNGAKIQFGPMNDRIYLMKLGDSDLAELLPGLDKLAQKHGFGKIFAKVPAVNKQKFLNAGYRIEARVSNLYKGREGGLFLGKYLKPGRSHVVNFDELCKVLKLASSKEESTVKAQLPQGFEFRYARPEHAQMVSKVYRQVFVSYPFPIHDPEYILKTMEDDVFYFSIWHQGKMIALSSAELDRENKNVEMTDFATLANWRGNRLGIFLLRKMVKDIKKMGIKTAYTIARAISPGMNITFARLGYHYGGQLINNTQISGSLESMNVWHKSLV